MRVVPIECPEVDDLFSMCITDFDDLAGADLKRYGFPGWKQSHDGCWNIANSGTWVDDETKIM